MGVKQSTYKERERVILKQTNILSKRMQLPFQNGYNYFFKTKPTFFSKCIQLFCILLNFFGKALFWSFRLKKVTPKDDP